MSLLFEILPLGWFPSTSVNELLQLVAVKLFILFCLKVTNCDLPTAVSVQMDKKLILFYLIRTFSG